MKKRISLVLLLMGTTCLSGCSCLDFIKGLIEPSDSKISLNATEKIIKTGEKFQLEVQSKSFFSFSSYNWYSSNESVATVNSTGLVTGIKGGNATITVEDSSDPSINASCNFTVLAGITELTLSNVKKNYRVGESFENPTVYAIYDDGTKKEVQNSCKFQGFNMNVEGNYTVDVKYFDGSINLATSYTIRVSNGTFPTLKSIELSGQKTEFIQGDAFVFGGRVIAKYSDESTDNVTNMCTFSNYDMSVAGTQYPIVTYYEGTTKTKSYEITVSEVVTDLVKTKLKSTYSNVTSNSMYSNYDSAPSTGNPKFLIIPVWFTDSSNYILSSRREEVRSDIQKAYLGTTDETGWHSVSSYYKEESHNRLNIQGVVAPWYESGESISKYDVASSTGQVLTASLAKKASDYYFSQSGSYSRSQFDSDNDGFLDGVILIYGCSNYAIKHPSDQAKDNLWAYCFWADNPKSTVNPGVCSYFWASFDFMYGSSTIYSKTGKTNNGAGDTNYCKIDAHTYIHEMGHILGLDDYYDYSTQAYSPAGGYTMQDLNMGGHDPFSCLSLGWVDPYIPKQTANIELKPFQSSGDVILLTPNWNVYDSPFDEYLLLEYYTPTGLNLFDSKHSYSTRDGQLPNASGIRVWHVDARLAYITGSKPSLSPSQITTNPNDSTKAVVVAAKNTYGGSHSSVLATEGYSQYFAFNLLQLIRKDKNADYYPISTFSTADLFTAGSTFSMNTYAGQFYNSGKLNSNANLGWSFRVNSIDANGASITVIKG